MKRLFATICLLASPPIHAADFALETLQTANISQGWGDPRMARSVDGNPMSIGGRSFAHGLGSHANGAIRLELDGKGKAFSAFVGVDEEVGAGKGSVEFKVLGDGKTLWESGVLKAGDAPRQVSVELAGVQHLILLALDGGDSNDFDHADWAEAVVSMAEGEPRIVAAPKEKAILLTPPAPASPRLNGARVVGARPGRPFLFTIPATGERPMAFAAEGLPAGLTLDAARGVISGEVSDRTYRTYETCVTARNARGEARRELRIVIGDRIALTPPMGWNSWNCFAHAVTAQHIKDAADQFVKLGLQQHGWTYINIDDYWQVHRDSKDPTLQGPHRDSQGRILPNPRFPDMKGLADYVHGLGLKIGLYSSPGPWTCGGCVGSYQHEEQDARTYAEWGFDYLKHDWCSYGNVVEAKTRADYRKPYEVMQAALAKQPRDIVYSLCQYGMDNVWEWGDEVGGNCWRTTGDITDTWGSLSGIGFSQAGHENYAGPGRWNDPDMLIVGQVGWGPRLHPTRLTPNEQYTHITLWCLLASPLLIGCDLTKMDDFTLSLLTNDEVIEVNQDPLGRQAARVAKQGEIEVWAKDMEDGSKAVGLFNRGEIAQPATAAWADLGLAGARRVRDLWRQQDLGTSDGEVRADVPRHGAVLLRLSAP